MPKFTVSRYRTVEDEWHNVEAEDEARAIEQVLNDGREPDEIETVMDGGFLAEAQTLLFTINKTGIKQLEGEEG